MCSSVAAVPCDPRSEGRKSEPCVAGKPTLPPLSDITQSVLLNSGIICKGVCLHRLCTAWPMKRISPRVDADLAVLLFLMSFTSGFLKCDVLGMGVFLSLLRCLAYEKKVAGEEPELSSSLHCLRYLMSPTPASFST